jgi:hypothetical protein
MTIGEVMNESQLREKLRTFIKACGGQSKAAKVLCICQSYLNLMLSGKRPISDRVAGYFNYKKVVNWEKIK